MATFLYLAYGSNLHPTRLTARVASARLVATAVLGGYVLKYHKRGACGSGKCNAFFTGNVDDRVHGAVYQMSHDDKERLDTFEGKGYAFREVTVEIDGRPQIAFAYIAAGCFIDDGLRPYRWYQALVDVGARYLSFPEGYIRKYVQVDTQDDPDPARHAQHMDLLTLIKRTPPTAHLAPGRAAPPETTA